MSDRVPVHPELDLDRLSYNGDTPTLCAGDEAVTVRRVGNFTQTESVFTSRQSCDELEQVEQWPNAENSKMLMQHIQSDAIVPATPASVLFLRRKRFVLNPRASVFKPASSRTQEMVVEKDSVSAPSAALQSAVPDFLVSLEARLAVTEIRLGQLHQELTRLAALLSITRAGAEAQRSKNGTHIHRSSPLHQALAHSVERAPNIDALMVQTHQRPPLPRTSPGHTEASRTDAQPMHPLQHLLGDVHSPGSSVCGLVGSPMEARRQESREDHDDLGRFVQLPAGGEAGWKEGDTWGPWASR